MTPSPFSSNIPKFQTVWDSTSLGWLKTCPRLYQYQMLEHWTPRSTGIHLKFGQLYASGLEHYAHSSTGGASHDDAVQVMVKWALENSGEYTPTDGNEAQWTPWESGDAYKNRYTLIRSLLWNVDDLADSPWKTLILANGRPAVELSFNFEAFTLHGEAIHLAGHMDKIVENAGQVYVSDDKTTKGPIDAHYFRQYTPHNQMSLYALAGKIILGQPVSGVLVRAAQIGVTFTRFATAQVPRPAAVLTEWLDDAKYWIGQAREFALAEHWPMNDKACYWCDFKKVCGVSPSHRQAWLEQDFVKFEWNPCVPRGDI